MGGVRVGHVGILVKFRLVLIIILYSDEEEGQRNQGQGHY
jgi:hypothetical protein